MAVGESVFNGTLLDTGRPLRGNLSLTKYGVSTWWTTYFPITRGTEMGRTNVNLKEMESSASGDSDKGSCTGAPQIGATGRDPDEQGEGDTRLIRGGGRPSPSNLSSESLEDLTEKVGTLGLRATGKNRCGAAKKQARRARLVEAPSGDSGGDQPETLQKPGTSGVHRSKSTESRGLPPGPSKRQR